MNQDKLKELYEKDKLMLIGAYDFAKGNTRKGYTHRVRCLNCNWSSGCYIPFGITIKEYLYPKKCHRCQCAGRLV